MPENYLALDVGEKRIGVAVGSTIPFGRGVLDATQPEVTLDKIKELIENEKISKIILGLPKVRSGDMTQSQQIVHDWVARLKQVTELPIELIDESYSSLEAEAQLRAMHVDTQQEKGRVDERAAELILEQYLESGS